MWRDHYVRFCSLIFLLFENISLMWRCHHWGWRAAKVRSMLGTYRPWAGEDIYYPTPVLRSAKRAPANVRRLNNRKWRQRYCLVGELSRALALLNAALLFAVLSEKLLNLDALDDKKGVPRTFPIPELQRKCCCNKTTAIDFNASTNKSLD